MNQLIQAEEQFIRAYERIKAHPDTGKVTRFIPGNPYKHVNLVGQWVEQRHLHDELA